MTTGKPRQLLFLYFHFTFTLILLGVSVSVKGEYADKSCDVEDRELCTAVCGNEEPMGCVELPSYDDYENFYCICQNKVSKIATYKEQDDVFCVPADEHYSNKCSCPVNGHPEENEAFECQFDGYEMCACASSSVEWVEVSSIDDDFDTDDDDDDIFEVMVKRQDKGRRKVEKLLFDEKYTVL